MKQFRTYRITVTETGEEVRREPIGLTPFRHIAEHRAFRNNLHDEGPYHIYIVEEEEVAYAPSPELIDVPPRTLTPRPLHLVVDRKPRESDVVRNARLMREQRLRIMREQRERDGSEI